VTNVGSMPPEWDPGSQDRLLWVLIVLCATVLTGTLLGYMVAV
jgi:hypothetical protein